MKIAVIGGGVSGLTAAYLLAPQHEVVLYESNSRLGGHAHTFTLQEGDQTITVDNGFMVFNPEQYPNFVGLLQELGVTWRETSMYLSVQIPGEITFGGAFPSGVFAERKNLVNPRFLRFLYEVLRFGRVSKRALTKGIDPSLTLDAFIKEHNFSSELFRWYLKPMLAAVWSMPHSDDVRNFPAYSTLTFLNNHKILDTSHPMWQTVNGGSIAYVSKVEQYLRDHKVDIRLEAKITNIARSDSSCAITSERGVDAFDHIMFATHADVTRQLLTDRTAEEDAALAKFRYSVNQTVLHKDTSYAPTDERLLSAWNYIEDGHDEQQNTLATFTYCMNILQHIPRQTPVYVTLNPKVPIDPSKVYATETYAHPEYSLATVEGQALIAGLQGSRRTYYAGAHLGYGFHEDGAASAVAVANQLGVKPQWQMKNL